MAPVMVIHPRNKGTSMHNPFTSEPSTIRRLGLSTCAAALMLCASTGAQAADKVAGHFGISYNSHFVSYGGDVWGAGGDFFGDKSTTFVTGDVTVSATDALSFNFGAWADVNDNTNSAIGGTLQEVDIWGGASYKIDLLTLGATYQSWNYAGGTEEVLDLSVGLDDSGFYGNGFALNPSVKWHIRTDGNKAVGQKDGSAVVLAVAPGFSLTDTVSLTIPAGVAFFTTDDFQGGTKSGYGYSYLGASVGVPLDFIPSDYGAWSLGFDVTGYFTRKDAIPGNPEENFVTGSVGLSLNF